MFELRVCKKVNIVEVEWVKGSVIDEFSEEGLDYMSVSIVFYFDEDGKLWRVVSRGVIWFD